MLIIGLDIGTSGCKATVFDGALHALTYAYREYAAIYTAEGYELDASLVWDKVQEVVAEAAHEARGRGEVAAISVSSFGEAVVLLDGQDRVLRNSILYTDARGQRECEQLCTAFGSYGVFERTGVHPHVMYTLPKLMWHRAHEPELWRRVRRVLLFTDYIVYRLCGEAVIDYSMASRTMGLDVTRKCWDAALWDAAGVDTALLSSPAPAGSVAGTVLPHVAEALHIPRTAHVISGAHDQVSAALGAGVTEAGLAVDGMGSVECITPCFDKPLLNRSMYNGSYACVPHAVEGHYVTYAFTFAAGTLLRWFRDQICPDVYKSGNVYAALDRAAADVDTDLLVLPYFAGAATPFMDARATGAMTGLTLGTTAVEIYRAILEGTTFEMLRNLETLGDAGLHVGSVRAVGGGANSALWLQIKADAMNMPVATLAYGEAGTLGNAMMAAVAVGHMRDLREAAAAAVRETHVFEPDAARHARYAEKYARYKTMYVVQS